MATWMPGRGKLPARCNKAWFLDFFQVNVDDSTFTKSEIWKNSALYLYDSLAMLSCVEPYVELHFTPSCFNVNGTAHRVIGLLDDDGAKISSVVNKDNLVREMACLLSQALSVSLEGSRTRESMYDDESSVEDDKSEGGRDLSAVHDEKKDTV